MEYAIFAFPAVALIGYGLYLYLDDPRRKARRQARRDRASWTPWREDR